MHIAAADTALAALAAPAAPAAPAASAPATAAADYKLNDTVQPFQLK